MSVMYVVKNQDVILNGTVSSGLLNQLTAELVGYFLFYPPLIIAERKLNSSACHTLKNMMFAAILSHVVHQNPYKCCNGQVIHMVAND